MINKKNTREQTRKGKHSKKNLDTDYKKNLKKSENKKHKKIKNVRKAKRIIISLLTIVIMICLFNTALKIKNNGGRINRYISYSFRRR